MPYIITTKRQTPFGRAGGQTIGGPVDVIVSRRANATLEDARESARDATAAHCGDYALAEWDEMALTLPESGGTIGPLPDGTVIEVKWAGLGDLAFAIGRMLAPDEKIIDAYNAVWAGA
jgi:hypothetical protein